MLPAALIRALGGSLFMIMESVTIKSSSSSNELQLSEQEGLLRPEGSEYYRVTLKAKDLVASAKVYAFQPHGELAQFFEDLASHWKSLDGERQWRSLEGEFALSCESDDRGHIAMRVVLKSGLYEDDWSVEALINVEAGQLVEIASNIRQFFSTAPPPNNSFNRSAS